MSKITALPMGRPKVEVKRNKVLKLYLTEAEMNWFKGHQKEAGYKQLSRFAYDLLSSMTECGRFSYDVPLPVNQKLQNAMLGLGNNVNQAMAFTHATGNSKHMKEFQTELRNALAVLGRVQQELREHKEASLINFPSAFEEAA
ncbi:MAG: hypothetical protein ACJAS1_002547 [Oleiphilaceae bacterium]|jgi:hypothetical protein